MNHWDQPEYQRIQQVTFNDGNLVIVFQNNDCALLSMKSLFPNFTKRESKHITSQQIAFSHYEITIDFRNTKTVLAWDFVRVLSDIEYNKFMVDEAESQAIRVGERLRKMRELRKISAKELSRRTGINTTSISRLENGRSKIVFYNLRRLLAAMGFTLRDLATFEDQYK